MSDGKEVKRYYFRPTGGESESGHLEFTCHDESLEDDDWFVLASDHDREMAKNSQLQREAYDAIREREKQIAELRAEVERLKGKTPTRIGFDGTRFKKVKDRFERAFSQLNRPNDTDEQFLISSVESLLLDVGELEARVLHDITYRDETIATQARVIEKLREQREFLIDVSDMSKEFRKIRRLDFDKELAAIEKGEGM